MNRLDRAEGNVLFPNNTSFDYTLPPRRVKAPGYYDDRLYPFVYPVNSTLETGLIGYWDLTSNLLDSGPNGIDLTQVGSVNYGLSASGLNAVQTKLNDLGSNDPTTGGYLYTNELSLNFGFIFYISFWIHNFSNLKYTSQKNPIITVGATPVDLSDFPLSILEIDQQKPFFTIYSPSSDSGNITADAFSGSFELVTSIFDGDSVGSSANYGTAISFLRLYLTETNSNTILNNNTTSFLSYNSVESITFFTESIETTCFSYLPNSFISIFYYSDENVDLNITVRDSLGGVIYSGLQSASGFVVSTIEIYVIEQGEFTVTIEIDSSSINWQENTTYFSVIGIFAPDTAVLSADSFKTVAGSSSSSFLSLAESGVEIDELNSVSFSYSLYGYEQWNIEVSLSNLDNSYTVIDFISPTGTWEDAANVFDFDLLQAYSLDISSQNILPGTYDVNIVFSPIYSVVNPNILIDTLTVSGISLGDIVTVDPTESYKTNVFVASPFTTQDKNLVFVSMSLFMTGFGYRFLGFRAKMSYEDTSSVLLGSVAEQTSESKKFPLTNYSYGFPFSQNASLADIGLIPDYDQNGFTTLTRLQLGYGNFVQPGLIQELNPAQITPQISHLSVWQNVSDTKLDEFLFNNGVPLDAANFL